MTLNRITHPDNPESYATHLQENYIIGGVPAIITSIKDPLKAGRIRCRCDLIDKFNDLPNGNDGWIPTVELFTVPEGSGGSHQPLKEGSLVLLLPILGKPNNWVCLGCIPNNVDRPSPQLDRSNGTHGFVTEGDVYHINNEVDNSQVISYPHGVKKVVTGTGDTITQTEGGGRQTIRQDGTVLTESPQASFSLSPEGDVVHQNAAGAIATLHNDGSVKIKNAFQAELKLDPSIVTLSGSLSGIGQELLNLKKAFGGHLTDSVQHLSHLKDIISDPTSLLHVDATLGEVSTILQKLEDGIGSTYKDGMRSLDNLKNLPLKNFEDAISQPIKFALENGLGTIIDNIRFGIEELNTPEELSLWIKESLPAEWSQNLPDLAEMIVGLQHEPNLLLEAILQKVVPGGIDATLVRTGFYQSLHSLQKISSEYFDKYSELEEMNIDMNDFLVKIQNQVYEALPTPIQKVSSPHTLLNIVTNPQQTLSKLVALSQQDAINQGHNQLSRSSSLIDLIKPTNGLIKALETGNTETNHYLAQLNNFKPASTLSEQNLVSEVLKPLTDNLQPMLKDGAAQVSTILNSVAGLAKGALLKLETYSATLQASNLLPSGSVKVDATGGYLQAANGLSQLFATLGGAGIKTPHGRFSFGGRGGGFFGKGLMALRVFQDVGKSAGLLLHPQNGVSLSSFPDGYIPAENEQVGWEGQTAEVTVDDGTIKIVSHNNPYAGIIVNGNGTYINGLLIYDYAIALRRDLTTLQVQVQSNPQAFPVTASVWADEAQSISGNFFTGPSSSQRYGYFGSFSSPVIGAQIQFSFFLKEGSYTASFLTRNTSDSGIATILINNIVVGTFDNYSATAIDNVEQKIAIAVPKSGTQALTIKMTTKNNASSSYNLCLTKFWIN